MAEQTNKTCFAACYVRSHNVINESYDSERIFWIVDVKTFLDIAI